MNTNLHRTQNSIENDLLATFVPLHRQLVLVKIVHVEIRLLYRFAIVGLSMPEFPSEHCT